MVTTELGACEWFVWDLRRSNLIERGQLDQIVGDFMRKNPRAEPPALAEFLVQQGSLSPFQSERLLQGKTQGFVLGPMVLFEALGAGSMGTVYKAQSKNDNKWYAVKVLPRRSMWNVRIARRKVRAFETCRHPAVVPFIDVGTAGSTHYLVWPFVEGDMLEAVVTKNGKLSPGVVAQYGLQIAEALDVCHQQALFHGLLKPSNVMIGKNNQVHVLDFGIGSLLSETEGESLVDTMSTANSVTSGLDCASPESIMDPTNLTPAGDQYSLGCVLYYCLTGQYPFPDGSAAEKMMAHQFKEPTPITELNPEVPPGLVDVVQRLMQKTPENRFAGAGAAAEALRPLADGAEQGKKPSARPAVLPMRLQESEAPRAVPVGPSTSTPKPSGSISLPTRHSLRGDSESLSKSKRPAAAAATPAAKPEKPRQDATPPEETWEKESSEIGVVLIAIAACVAAWALMTFLL